MGGKPSKGTPADKRLAPNSKKKVSPKAAAGAKPKFGTPAWNAKYGKKGK